jgi:hypothetical protein
LLIVGQSPWQVDEQLDPQTITQSITAKRLTIVKP